MVLRVPEAKEGREGQEVNKIRGKKKENWSRKQERQEGLGDSSARRS